jgi:hypothetical protein
VDIARRGHPLTRGRVTLNYDDEVLTSQRGAQTASSVRAHVPSRQADFTLPVPQASLQV